MSLGASLGQPKELVLDETARHLDLARERVVSDAIDQLSQTRIIIAHRPETIAMAERIVDMSAQKGTAADESAAIRALA